MTVGMWAKTRSSMVGGALLLAALLIPVPGNSQPLFEDNFGAVRDGQRPPRDRFAIGGAIDDEFWFGDGGNLNTGNFDNTPSGINLAFINRPEAREWTDIALRVNFQMLQPDGSILLAIRQQDLSNFYMAKITSLPQPSGVTQRVAEIAIVQRNIVTVLSSRGQGGSPLNVPPYENTGQSHEIEFRAVGNRLTLLLGGQEILTTTDGANTFPKGSAGFGGANTQLIFNNVAVLRGADAARSTTTGSAFTASAQSGSWRLMAASGLSRSDAESLRNEMLDSSNAEVKEIGGRFAILVGRFPTREAAEAEKERVMEREGFFSVEVIQDAPAESGPQRFVVEAGVFPTAAEAARVRARLEETQGLFEFETIQDGNRTRLIVGRPFDDRAEAESLAAEIRGEAPNATVVAQAQPRAALVVDETALSSLSQQDRESARLLINMLNQGAATGDRQPDFDRQFREANAQVQQQVRAIQEMANRQAEQERLAAERNQLSTEVASMMEQKRWTEARSRLERLRTIDQGNPIWNRLMGEVDTAIRQEREARTSPDPTPMSPAERLAALIDSAQQAEARAAQAPAERRSAAFDEARRLWQDVQRTAPDLKTREEATTAIQRINSQVASGEPTAPSGGGGMLLYIIIGVVVLGGGAAAFFVFAGRKKGATAPSSKPITPSIPAGIPSTSPTAAVTPLPLPIPATPAPRGAAATTPVPVATAPRTPLPVPPATPLPKGNVPQPVPQTPATPTSAAPPAGPSNVRIAPGVFLPAGEQPSTGAAGSVMPPLNSGDQPPLIPATPPSGVTPVPATPAGIPPTSSSGQVALPDTAPALHNTPPSGVVALTGDDFFVQNFDDEAVGSVPKNWRGAYDYASLAVVDRPEGGRCMKFEKKTGSGSAYFACRFPDAGGKVLVEFDLKCQDKNKYLLGFYIEKDEDFRHSIHTVVHKDVGKGDKVTLRLQNESCPYEFGEWVKVRFHIDLTRHLVDGYVNDKPVAIGVRLVSRPKVVNTLSIRDNLLTEGILFVDNIRISRDR